MFLLIYGAPGLLHATIHTLLVHVVRSNDIDGMFVLMENSVFNTVLQSASLSAIAYDSYFMFKRYAIVSKNGITVLNRSRRVSLFGLFHV